MLRGFIAWIEEEGRNPVPFQRMYANEMPDLMRGFRDFRWRDRGMTVFSAEYRWPLWTMEHVDGPGVDAYLLADVGQVFGDRREIQINALRGSFGGGVRYIGRDGFGGRIEYARSEEETSFRFSAEQVFQFDKNGLMHGKNPIPSR